MSVVPSSAFIVIGIGGFHPVASKREMSARSSGITNLPFAFRNAVTGGMSGLLYVSIRYAPEGDS
jgi:hypothetical protein